MNERDRRMERSIVQGEALRRRALEHRARWEAQRKREEERREREREDEAVARALRARGEATNAGGTNANGDANAGGQTEEEEERVCRICFAGEDAGRLFSPCLCRGSMGLVHVDCLNEWRSMSRNPRSFYGCDQCGYQYNLERTRAARYLEREEPALVLAALGVVALTIVAAATCRLSSHALFYALTRLRGVLDRRRAFPKLSKPFARSRWTASRRIEASSSTSLRVTSRCSLPSRPMGPPGETSDASTPPGSTLPPSPAPTLTSTLSPAVSSPSVSSPFASACFEIPPPRRGRAAEYVGPGLALTFLAHGSKGYAFPLRRRALRVRSTPRGGENAESSLTDPLGPTRVRSLEVIQLQVIPLTTARRRSVAPRATRRRANLGRTDGRRANENSRARGSRRRRRARVDRAHAAVPSSGRARRPPRVVMSDDDDYGFTYSDEDECDEEEVDVENAYYNAKGARGRDRSRSRETGNARKRCTHTTRAFTSFFPEREREERVNRLTDALERSPRAQVCSRMGRAKMRWRRSRRSSPWSARRVSGGSRR